MKLKDTIGAKQALILLVDDQIENLQILGNILNQSNYKRALATNGIDALNIADKKNPDLILLDIMMPNMNGFEVCEKLKDNPNTRHIPVIFLTAKTQVEDIKRGFEYGGVDYITKPFKSEELLARIETHIQLKQSKDTIIKQNQDLIRLNREKNTFLSIAIHDLKNPLQVITGFASLIKSRYRNLAPEDFEEFATDILESGENMMKIIEDLVELNKSEEGKLSNYKEEFDLNSLINNTIKKYSTELQNKSIDLTINNPDKHIYIYFDKEKISHILENIFSLVFKHTDTQTTIFFSSEEIDNPSSRILRMKCTNAPAWFSEDIDLTSYSDKILDLSTLDGHYDDSSILSFSIIKNYVDQLNGKILYEKETDKGISFIVDLPL